MVYRRHTNFALESIEQTFNGVADFGKKVTATISRNGDLIHRTYLQTVLPALSAGAPAPAEINWVPEVGHALIKTVELEIGGQRIDKHYAAWLHIWNELSQPVGLQAGYDKMIGNVSSLTTGALSVAGGYTLYVPLQFWFCRNPGLALPLIALQYHEVKVNIEFEELRNLVQVRQGGVVPTTGSLGATSLWVDYIYLDAEERRRFAQVSHEYLIEQLQFTGDESTTSQFPKIKLNFNHPVKFLTWTVSSSPDHAFDFTDNGANPVVSAKLQLNGHDRFAARPGSYFNYVQPFQHCENIPAEGINVYSFALQPLSHQPSGSCNMSRIDNATLQIDLASASSVNIKVMAVNYNVLRIMSGMGGLAYSN